MLVCFNLPTNKPVLTWNGAIYYALRQLSPTWVSLQCRRVENRAETRTYQIWFMFTYTFYCMWFLINV